MAVQGGVVKKTSLTEFFTLEDFARIHGEESHLLFMDHPEKGLMPINDETENLPDGTVIYALIPQSQPEKKELEAQPMGL